MVFKGACTFDIEFDHSRGISKFYRIRKDIEEHLLELHIIAYIIVLYSAQKPALVFEALLVALRHYHGVDLFEHGAERELFLPQYEPA